MRISVCFLVVVYFILFSEFMCLRYRFRGGIVEIVLESRIGKNKNMCLEGESFLRINSFLSDGLI